MPTDDQSVLLMLLFDLRGLLTVLKGMASLIDELEDDIPAEVLAWFHKWAPAFNAWASAEARARPYAYESYETPPNWEQIIAEVGKSLEDVSKAHAEAQTLAEAQQIGVKTEVEMTLSAISRLNDMRRLIQSQEYKHLYQQSDA